MLNVSHIASAAVLAAVMGFAGGQVAHATIPVINLARPSSPSMSTSVDTTIPVINLARTSNRSMSGAAYPAIQGAQLEAYPDGQLVKELQGKLDSRGAHLRVDGRLGQKTMTALLNYQSEHGLNPSGRINSATEESLGIL